MMTIKLIKYGNAFECIYLKTDFNHPEKLPRIRFNTFIRNIVIFIIAYPKMLVWVKTIKKNCKVRSYKI